MHYVQALCCADILVNLPRNEGELTVYEWPAISVVSLKSGITH